MLNSLPNVCIRAFIYIISCLPVQQKEISNAFHIAFCENWKTHTSYTSCTPKCQCVSGQMNEISIHETKNKATGHSWQMSRRDIPGIFLEYPDGISRRDIPGIFQAFSFGTLTVYPDGIFQGYSWNIPCTLGTLFVYLTLERTVRLFWPHRKFHLCVTF